jgi:hypothetical protein
MKRWLRLTGLAIGAAALMWTAATGLRGAAPEAAPAVEQPPEYAALIEDLLEHIAAGRIGEGVTLFEQNAVGVNDLARESLRSQFATLHTAGGSCDGIEIVAVQPISPRLHRVFALMHFERSPIVFAVHVRQFQGRWSLGHFQYSADVIQYLGGAPVRFLAESGGEGVAASQ